MTTPTWDPAQYLRHADHRARPFTDLLARVPDLPGKTPLIADLGCGPGNMTAVLAARWPTARITGYDNSAEMLDKAQVEYAGPTSGGGHLDFAHADVRTWAPAQPYDLIVSNPPYVTAGDMSALPAEYRHEPALALAAGADGLDIVRRILREAKLHLQRGGVLIVEVGDGRAAVESAFPDLPFTWLETGAGNDRVFLLERGQLAG